DKGVLELPGIDLVDNIEEAIDGVDVVIGAMGGTDERGYLRTIYTKKPLLLTEEMVARLPNGTPFYVGYAKPYLKNLGRKYNFRVIEVAEFEDIAIYNSIPTAEGAIQIAMEQLPITIHGSRNLIIGFGRIGQTLARMLVGLGAKVTVLSRDPGKLARAEEMGFVVGNVSEVGSIISEFDIIHNTAPAMVLTYNVLKNCLPDVLIIDLASAPGGTDFAAAKELGLKAIFAPGLPAKVAPKTAGQILARIMPKLICQDHQNRSNIVGGADNELGR
ncbi:MAG: dipicolinate synthase subunit DpsA, partial [Fischerella sp.]|nr:dipicolinate synthase subunit DpsA [Fischerella sp.]